MGTQSWLPPAGVNIVDVTSVPPYVPQAGALGLVAGGIDITNALFMWGSNGGGMNGSGTATTTASLSSPVAVVGGLVIKQYLNKGSTVQVIDRFGTMYSWGQNQVGELGQNLAAAASAGVSSPVAVSGGLRWSRLPQHMYNPIDTNQAVPFAGIDEVGQVWTCGKNANGQLGNNSATAAFSSPVQVVGGLLFNWLSISQGVVGGVDSNNNAWMWGINNSGIMGNGTSTAAFSSPVQVVGGIAFKKIFTFTNMALGLDTSDQLWGWGSNAGGILGNGVAPNVTSAFSSPVLVAGGIKWTDQIAICGSGGGGSAIVAIDTSQQAWGWGPNTNGVLGLGDRTSRSSPVQVVGGLKVQKVKGSAGTIHLLTTAGLLYGVGSNSNGQLGVNDLNDRSSPTAVSGGLVFTDMFVDYNNNQGVYGNAITPGGKLYSWGTNNNGQLATGGVVATSSPVLALGTKTFMSNQSPSVSISMPVIPNVGINVSTIGSIAMFGDKQLGQAEAIVVEYEA